MKYRAVHFGRDFSWFEVKYFDTLNLNLLSRVFNRWAIIGSIGVMVGTCQLRLLI